jgi:twitching motility two-component system response regulator PilH
VTEGPSPGRILIVDDSDDNVTYVSQILQHYGYEFAVARDGAEALEVMLEDPPVLVLLDIMMPKKSGVGVFKRMKTDPKLQGIPVIFVSGASMVTGVDMKTGDERPKSSYKDDFSRSFGTVLSDTLQELEPDGYVEKPIHPPTLVAMIKELLA